MAATLKTTVIQEPSSASANITLDSNGNGTFAGTAVMSSPYTMRNKIINGAMVIDQRNAGASVTPTVNSYCIDRWQAIADAASKYSVQQVSDAPTGFTNSLKFTSLSAYTVGATQVFGVWQPIEGFNTADLAFGSASAITVTMSFWVKSSLTGTFGGALNNSAYNRNYPFSYTISSANTWEQKTVTITGDTTGTWLTNNGVGINVSFSIGSGASRSAAAGSWTSTLAFSSTGATSVVGTNGATWQLAGVQLERGTVATPFEYRNYQQELAMCQRYLPAWSSTSSGATALTFGNATTTTNGKFSLPFPVSARVPPTGVVVSSAAHFFEYQTGAVISCTGITFNSSTYLSGAVDATVASGLTAGGCTMFGPQSTSALIYFTGCEL